MFAWFKALSIGAKLAVGVGAIVAVLLAITLLVRSVSSWEDSLKQAGRDEVQAQWNAADAAATKAKADTEHALVAALQPQFDQLSTRINGIDTTAARVQVTMPKAISAAPRYTDTNCSLTSDVLDQVNAARALSANQEPAK